LVLTGVMTYSNYYYRAQLGFVVLAFITAYFIYRNDLERGHHTLTLSAPEPPIFTDPRFLSFSIDTSLLVGADWWSKSGTQSENTLAPADELDLSNPRLNLFAHALSPAYLRIGGTAADELFLGSSIQFNQQNGYDSYLEFERFKQLTDFIQRNELDWMFTLNYLNLKPSQINRFLAWQARTDVSPALLELGNEVGAFWIFYGWQAQKSMSDYGQDFETVRSLLGHHDLAGPANAFWPWLGEPGALLFGSSRKLLAHSPTVFTWHYYPSQSQRCGVASQNGFSGRLLSTDSFKKSQQQALTIQQWVKQDSPTTQLILGETGPAQCGGISGVTDRFASSLWWLSHLGVMARSGQSVVVRQTLIGADYALLNDQFDPNPDYWASWLFKNIMGTQVLESAPLIKHNVRSFAHCHAQKPNTIALLLVNASDQAKTRNLSNLSPLRAITITSNHLRSSLVYLNGTLMDASLITENSFDDLPWTPMTTIESLTLPASSYTFVELDDTHSLCLGDIE
jgi:heparanase